MSQRDENERRLSIRISPGAHRHIHEQAARADISAAELIRRALIAAAVLPDDAGPRFRARNGQAGAAP